MVTASSSGKTYVVTDLGVELWDENNSPLVCNTDDFYCDYNSKQIYKKKSIEYNILKKINESMRSLYAPD